MRTPPTTRTRVIAIVGPTAVGKTAVADALAHDLGSEVVTADSMQVYRGMDVGTAKPSPAERTVVHHCLDLVDPDSPYSAALYQLAAREAIDSLLASGKHAVLCGGTGMYVRAALDDWEFPEGEQTDNPVREQLESLADELGPEGLHAHLARLDPRSAELIHPNNVRRVVRALELLEQGTTYAGQHSGFAVRQSVYPTEWIGLDMDREALYARIDARVDLMIASGLLAEVESLMAAGFTEALTAAQAIGYKELVPVIERGVDLDEAVESIKRSSRRYAKRQLTWFRADPRITWVDVTGLSSAAALEAVRTALDLDARERPTEAKTQ